MKRTAEIIEAEQLLDTQDLRIKYGAWGEHPHFTAGDWKYEVENEGTRRGYWDWVESQIDQEEPDVEGEPS